MFPSLFAKVAQELTNTVTGKKTKKTKPKPKEECINKKQSQGIRKNIHIDYWFKMWRRFIFILCSVGNRIVTSEQDFKSVLQ